MKKLLLLCLVAAVVVIAGCPTTKPPETTTAKTEPRAADIIDHQNRGLGEVNFWVTKDVGELETDARFKNMFVFKESFSGGDLNAVKTLAQNFVIDEQIARVVSLRIKTKFAGAMVGDQNKADVYFEKLVKSVAEGQIAGAKKYGDYWIKRRYFKTDGSLDKDVFEVWLLITVPAEEVRKAVARAFDANPALTEQETKARARVDEMMKDKW